MRYFLKEEEKKEFLKIWKAFEKTLQESSYWNEVLEQRIPKRRWLKKAKALESSFYEEDPYFKNVTPLAANRGTLSLSYQSYKKEQGFVYDEIQFDPDTYEEKTPFGYFEKPFRFLALIKNGQTWMSVIPHEMNTMRKSIEEAQGKVLVLGLGLGYYPYSLLLKENISTVTVVEYDSEIISLFEKSLEPFFPCSQKLNLVKEDAFHYLAKERNFDYCFADLWHMPKDGLPMYLKLRKLEKIQGRTVFRYWIENSMLALLRRALIVLIYEELFEGKRDESYLFSETFDDGLINSLHFLLKDVSIKNMADLRRYLDIGGLRMIAESLTLEA